MNRTDLSIIIPVYNEEGNVVKLTEEIKTVLSEMEKESELSYEIIFINDGSTDRTEEILLSIPGITVISFDGNYGQTAAMDAGFKHASGRYIISMDGDCQNDPQDIPLLINTIRESGADVVCGVRKNRQDSFSKRIMSKGAGLLRKIIISDNTTDSGCTLRIYTKESIEGLNLINDQHRFIPAIIRNRGFKVTETEVSHRKRESGETKYRFSRIFSGLRDLFILKFSKYDNESFKENYTIKSISEVR